MNQPIPKYPFKMIISVHLPKTAGSSFLLTLEGRFGKSILRDYSDYPINTPAYERNKAALQASLYNAESDFSGIECIHGHFLPLKYLLMATKRKGMFVTWMRNPVDRLISHYHFWIANYIPEKSGSLRRKVVEEDWSIEQFCLAPEFRNFYTQFLWGFPIENFAFIGVSEFYESDLRYFNQHYLGIKSEPAKINVGHYNRAENALDKSLRKEIEQYHECDMNLYQKVLEIRQKERK